VRLGRLFGNTAEFWLNTHSALMISGRRSRRIKLNKENPSSKSGVKQPFAGSIVFSIEPKYFGAAFRIVRA